MGSRSIANMVFVVLLAGALALGLVATFEMLQAALTNPT
jgi:Flp pilus assembly pilin Flp